MLLLLLTSFIPFDDINHICMLFSQLKFTLLTPPHAAFCCVFRWLITSHIFVNSIEPGIIFVDICLSLNFSDARVPCFESLTVNPELGMKANNTSEFYIWTFHCLDDDYSISRQGQQDMVCSGKLKLAPWKSDSQFKDMISIYIYHYR